MDFIIVTGLSGAGKSRAIDAMEDIGFYCVDNIPPKLIPTFYDLCKTSNEKVAVVTDIRGGEMFNNLIEVLDRLKKDNKPYKILYLDAREDVLLRRYKETRRKHPLIEKKQASILEAIRLEKEVLKTIKEQSDYIVDTSYISPAQLKSRISSLFLEDAEDALMIDCESFGFKYGTPTEADLIFDVRCLPNPFYIDELKKLTGIDEEVKEYVLGKKETQGFVERMISLIDYMLPLYRSEGKSQLIVAFGCTGGKHRSVALAQLLYNHLSDLDYKVSVYQRDIHKP